LHGHERPAPKFYNILFLSSSSVVFAELPLLTKVGLPTGSLFFCLPITAQLSIGGIDYQMYGLRQNREQVDCSKQSNTTRTVILIV
jgi:hypothetical protein